VLARHEPPSTGSRNSNKNVRKAVPHRVRPFSFTATSMSSMSSMSSTQTFSTRTLLTIATGIQLPEVTFEQTLQAIGHLLGESLAPHQLATPEPWLRAKEELFRQHPEYQGSTLKSLREAQNVETWISKELEILGPSTLLERGVGRDPRSVTREALSSLIAIATKAP
jgi:hypothetical protein